MQKNIATSQGELQQQLRSKWREAHRSLKAAEQEEKAIQLSTVCACEKTLRLHFLAKKRSPYQDRLGTSTGKALKTEEAMRFFCSQMLFKEADYDKNGTIDIDELQRCGYIIIR